MIFKTKYARILGTNSKKPITSVINPGVSKKHPDIKIKIPLIKGLKGFPIFPLNWFFNSINVGKKFHQKNYTITFL